MATSSPPSTLTLYGYYRSSCTARLRIALRYKDIEFDYIPVNILHGFHLADEYVRVNPCKSVPTLIVPGHQTTPITQSCAGLEYLEEVYPDRPALLPRDSFARAQVRSLIEIITNDVQPVTNMKIMNEIRDHSSVDHIEWARRYHAKGFDAYELVVAQTAGAFSVGDDVTLADVCLVPAIWNAERWGVDMTAYPLIRRIYENASAHVAFSEGHWRKQVDCPEELR